MSRRSMILVALAAAVLILHGQSVLASTVVVGTPPCQPGPHFSTIQAAVSAVPAGSTVLVCPGSYPEQVVIDHPITLRGLIIGTSGAAVITVPAGGLVGNVTTPTYGLEAAQLLLQNFTGAQTKVLNIAIDGTGSTCPTLIGATRSVGIKMFNVGDAIFPSSAGIVQSVVVRNEIDGCGLGEAIDAENSFFTVQNTVIRGIERNGIVQIGGAALIDSNTMIGVNLWGISVSGATKTNVTNNVLRTQSGILLNAGTTTTGVYYNTVFADPGISLIQVPKNDIRYNDIIAGFTGLLLIQSSNNNVVGNEIRVENYGIVDEVSGGGNTIITNTVNDGALCEATAGASADILLPNTFENCVVTTQFTP
jgi:hypothetical protein